MNEDDLATHQDETSWDWDRAESQSQIEHRRSVLAVPFDRDEMERIRCRAETLGITVIDYVRRCALKAGTK